MSILRLKWRPLSRQTATATVGRNNGHKTEASVSCPHRGFVFLQRLPPNRCYSRILARPSRLKSSPGPELFLAVFSEAAAKFGQLSRVADFCDEPRLWPGTRCQLLYDRLSDRRWPKGDGVTSLCHGDVVLSSVLAEEQSLFTFEQARQVQSAYRYINFKFHTLVSFLFCFSFAHETLGNHMTIAR